MKFAAIALVLIVGVASIHAQTNNTIWGDVTNTRLLYSERVVALPSTIFPATRRVTHRPSDGTLIRGIAHLDHTPVPVSATIVSGGLGKDHAVIHIVAERRQAIHSVVEFYG